MADEGEGRSEHDHLTGELLDGKYRVERLLGQGGMGAVYRATHLGTRRTVAVKVIRPRLSSDREFVERFRREAEAAGRLRHPNVVDVTDFGFARTASGQVAYLVMEYLDGCTLAEVLDEEQRLPTSWVVEILEQVCSAVDEAHRLGVIHRDLKPENIWLEPNRRGGYTIKVLDFGLAKLGASAEAPRPDVLQVSVAAGSASGESPARLATPAGEEAATLLRPGEPAPPGGPEASELFAPTLRAGGDEAPTRLAPAHTAGEERSVVGAEVMGDLTRAGSVMGTPLYMSPEQCLGQRLDARSDVYSLGVIAYRMLAGEPPFVGSFDELKRLHSAGEPERLRNKNPRVPRRMARVVMSALAKDPARRPASAAGLGAALRASVEGSGTLLRHAAAIYSEHFPAFLKISLLAYAPLVAVLFYLYFMDEIFPAETLQSLPGTLMGYAVFLAVIVTSLFAYFAGSALTIPLVVQLIVAPLRPVSVRTAFAALRRRWSVFSLTSLAVMATTLAGAVFLVVPGIVAALSHVLYAPVAVMEGKGVRATLKRARALVARSWGTVLVVTALQFTLPVLVWVASIDASFTLRLDDDYNPKEFGFFFNMSGQSSLYQLLNIFITPLTAITLALLYLKTRQAGGEALGDVAEQFEALEVPRSRWQARMRSRLISRTSGPGGRDTRDV